MYLSFLSVEGKAHRGQECVGDQRPSGSMGSGSSRGLLLVGLALFVRAAYLVITGACLRIPPKNSRFTTVSSLLR